MQYIIVNADSAAELVELINEKLEEGYKLQGGVSVAQSRDQGYVTEVYAQAMTK